MPQERQTVLLSLFFSFPSVKNYLSFSIFLFVSGFYYYYKILQSLNMSLIDYKNGTVFETSEIKTLTFFEKIFAVVIKHRLLFCIFLNTCCAIITFIGKLIIDVFFKNLSTQEENLLKKTFRRFIQSKFIFLIFISHHNLFEDILIWMPWLAINVVCTLILELSSSRMSNPFNVVSNNTVRKRLYTANTITGIFSILMSMFVLSIHNQINVNYTLFLLADCCLLFVQSIHLTLKLYTIVDSNSQRAQLSSNSSYYVDLTYDLVHDSIEFVNYLHMIFFSQLAVTYCCVFLIVQAKQYYTRISTKIQKHWQNQEIIRHISTCYAKASEEDLLKNISCTICWQIMKTARKLPCGHVFHEICLRRWLEQDSSCAICRQSLSLNLNNVLQEGELATEDVDNALQYVVEVFSPHNNRLARWWTRLLFETMNDEQVSAMVNRVAEMFPNRTREEIQNAVRDAGSINGAVDFFLAQNNSTENADRGVNNERRNRLVTLNESETDDSSNGSNSTQAEISEEDSEISTTNNVNTVESTSLNITLDNGVVNMPLKNYNPVFVQRAKDMIENNRRRYLQSSRAHDIRHLCLPNL